MVGSLVVVLPTKHEGGALLFRHGGREFTFDSANAVATTGEGAPQAAYVAFYSDVEHEVTPVTSGYRVTLTYNLYLATPGSPITAPPAPSAELQTDISHFRAQMKTTLTTLLNQPTFLPLGGYLGFGLSHRYPFSSKTDLSKIEDSLKGTDATLAQICDDLHLSYELQAVYADENAQGVWALVDEFPRFEGWPSDESEIIECLKQAGYNPTIVYDVLKGLERRHTDDAQPILWMKQPTSVNAFETAYISYGNEATLDYAYGDVCLVADVLSGTARTQGNQ
jgi:hypothetical protein